MTDREIAAFIRSQPDVAGVRLITRRGRETRVRIETAGGSRETVSIREAARIADYRSAHPYQPRTTADQYTRPD